MNKTLEDLLNVEKPILTTKLAPKLAPFAKIVYLVGLVIVAGGVLTALKSLFSGEVYQALFVLINAVAELALLRMFCEYLVSSESHQ